MFNWLFGKKQEEIIPVAEIPEVSPGEALRAKIQEAQDELDKMSHFTDNEKKTLTALRAELLALELRAAGLTEAIAVGQANIAGGGVAAEKVKVYVKKAQEELSENLTTQESLNERISNIESFLETAEEHRTQLEEIVRHRDQRLSALEMREVSVKINKSIADVDGNIDDYRRHVFTTEAKHELSTGII
jgi:chromosome segregation ATPase